VLASGGGAATPDFDYEANWYKNQIASRDFSIPEGSEGVFNTGGYPESSAPAWKYAEQNGYTTIGMTPGGDWLSNYPVYETLPQDLADEVWGGASGKFANSARGRAHVFYTRFQRPGSIYNTIEKPTLIRKGVAIKLHPVNY
jgi:hypothetical protein